MIMEEINPLQIYKLPSKISEDKTLINGRGRPTAENTTKFSEQPKSIVSQLLKKMKNGSFVSLTNHNIDLDPLSDLRSHSPEIKESVKDLENICKICLYRCCDEKEFKRHLAIHKKYTCDYPNCLYTCKLSSNLIKHKRVHTDERPYLCDRCSFRSNFINSLKVHKRIHTAERPYHCKHCTYKCNSSSNLKKHCLHRHSIKQNVQDSKEPTV